MFESTDQTQWIKIPEPGQFRGAGNWQTIKDAGITEREWLQIRETNYLPTHVGKEAPTP